MNNPLSRRRLFGGAGLLCAWPALIRGQAATDVDVVVIGAGAAGLAAAAWLGAAGRRVVVLEARSRIGGRTSTETAPLGLPFDWGAHWLLKNKSNSFFADAARLGRSTWESPQSRDVRLVRDGQAVPDGPARLRAALGELGSRVWLRSLLGGDFALGAAARGEMQTVAAHIAAFSMATDADRLARALEIAGQWPDIRGTKPLPLRETQTLLMELLAQKALEQGLEAVMFDSPAWRVHLEQRERG
jgi:monoamine oxidase